MYVNTGSGEEGILFWGLSPSDNNQQINNYKAQYGITNPCAGTEGGGPAAKDVVIAGQNFLGYPTYCVICPDRTVYFDICWPPTEQCFYPYFDMCAPPILAGFTASDYDICEGQEVQFSDESTGNITSWEWTFEGGTPATSTEENPTVSYDVPGEYDVTLTVSDGTNTNTITSPDIMLVDTLPEAYVEGDGETCLDQPYTVEDAGVMNSMMINWEISSGEGILTGVNTITPTYTPDPADAGNTVVLNLNAHGMGGCNDQTAVASKHIDVFALPEVTIPASDTACIEWEPFGLTGGMPEGGTYSGTGVENGMFDPEVAGMGMHIITYTYADENSCENEAQQQMYVTSCVGIEEISPELLQVFPNPASGKFFVKMDMDGVFQLHLMNISGQKVFETSMAGSLEINLPDLDDGIYMLKIFNENYNFVRKLSITRE